MNEYVKEMFTRFGALLPARAIYNLNAVASYLETGRWMRAEGYSVGRRVGRREDLFDQVAKAVADRVVLYLEFGVYKMRHLIGRNGCAIPVVDSTALIPLRGYPKIGF